MAYEALYRRYRPATFGQIAGQTHVVATLVNAVESNRVGHAYLFSGPRGTGKTSSARILAKALNCTNLAGGEPCCECESCLAFAEGTSYDLHELDAASNNGVDAMRDLIGKVALGSPGRTKVYILDEVHMLSSGAENALLKTLEEPPSHVVFVLCTTEPNKVVSTIRSRTQQLNFTLLSSEEILGLVDYVATDAGLNITEADREYVLRTGGGSARDTLSALDRVVAAGGAPSGAEHFEALFDALGEQNPGKGLAAIDAALRSGHDVETIAAEILHELRTIFLYQMKANLDAYSQMEIELATKRAHQISPARVTRAMETLGRSLIDMRHAADPRIDLEVAFIRLSNPELDNDVVSLAQRITALEQRLGAAPDAGLDAVANQPAPAPQPQPGPAPQPVQQTPAPQQAQPQQAQPQQAQPQPAQRPQQAQPQSAQRPQQQAPQSQRPQQTPQQQVAPPAQPQHRPQPRPQQQAPQQAAQAPQQPRPQQQQPGQQRSSGAAAARAMLQGATEKTEPVQPQQRRPTMADVASKPAKAQPSQSPAPSGAVANPDEVKKMWPEILGAVPPSVRARFSAGYFLDSPTLEFGVPTTVHRQRCAAVRESIDQALATHFGQTVPFEIVVDDTNPEPAFLTEPAPEQQPQHQPQPQPQQQSQQYHQAPQPQRQPQQQQQPPQTEPYSAEQYGQPPSYDDHEDPGAYSQQPPPHDPDEWVDMSELTDAPDAAVSGLDRVLDVFEGSTVIEDTSQQY